MDIVKVVSLSREIKEDRRGLYFHYGSERLRPYRPSLTQFCLGERVLVEPRILGSTGRICGRTAEGCRVYREHHADYSEIWRNPLAVQRKLQNLDDFQKEK